MKIPYIINKKGKLAPAPIPAFSFDGYYFSSHSWQSNFGPTPGLIFLDGYV